MNIFVSGLVVVKYVIASAIVFIPTPPNNLAKIIHSASL